jgi:hypothetical protein
VTGHLVRDIVRHVPETGGTDNPPYKGGLSPVPVLEGHGVRATRNPKCIGELRGCPKGAVDSSNLLSLEPRPRSAGPRAANELGQPYPQGGAISSEGVTPRTVLPSITRHVRLRVVSK